MTGRAPGNERDANTGATRNTTSAIGPDGRTIYFDDLVLDGETVEVQGRRMVVRYDPAAPDWFVEETRSGACSCPIAHERNLEMDESYKQLKRAVGALASALRSGEPWSEQLQAEYDAGLRALEAMYATRGLPSDD